MVLLLPAALAAPATLTPAEARLDGPLRAAARAAEAGSLDRVRFARPEPLPLDGVSVSIEADDPEGVRAALAAAGVPVLAAAHERMVAFVAYDELLTVASIPGVRKVREPWEATPKARETEGYDAIFEQDWHVDGIDGTGVRIGILDVGFARLDAVGSTEIPADREEDFSRGRVDASEHGTAVTEIVYDFAPGARYYLATIGNEVDLAEALAWMVEERVDVVNASVGFDNVAHADGQSYVTRAADAAVEAGIIYIAAAGNENDKYRVGALARAAGGGVMLAGAASVLAWAPGGYARVSLRWSEPFGSAATDLDLVLYNEDGTECGRSVEPQSGDGDPYEIVFASGCSDLVTALIDAPTGDDPAGLEGYLYAPGSLEESAWTHTEDLTLPGDTRLGVSVGAWDVFDGGVPEWSSRGPTNDGRGKPDVVAASGVSTATYGPGGFSGSSAAAPHVAGLAALWVDATGRRRQPERFSVWLRAHAEDVEAPGLDLVSGAGQARAAGVPESACATGGSVGGSPLLLALVLWTRRRR
jgi:subtilisin family serine protease